MRLIQNYKAFNFIERKHGAFYLSFVVNRLKTYITTMYEINPKVQRPSVS